MGSFPLPQKRPGQKSKERGPNPWPPVARKNFYFTNIGKNHYEKFYPKVLH